MNINEMKSALQMKKFYFKECSISRNSEIVDEEYTADLQKNITKNAEHSYTVQLDFHIYNNDVNLTVITCAEFIFEAENEETEEIIIGQNTVAIMFPFIRSQVSLLTTQPGMTPIVLPPINTTKL